jgi:hypothetical protein
MLYDMLNQCDQGANISGSQEFLDNLINEFI